jgi:hypothetical protein
MSILVDDDVLEHGQRRQAGQVRANKKHDSEVLQKLRDRGGSSA